MQYILIIFLFLFTMCNGINTVEEDCDDIIIVYFCDRGCQFRTYEEAEAWLDNMYPNCVTLIVKDN